MADRQPAPTIEPSPYAAPVKTSMRQHAYRVLIRNEHPVLMTNVKNVRMRERVRMCTDSRRQGLSGPAFGSREHGTQGTQGTQRRTRRRGRARAMLEKGGNIC